MIRATIASKSFGGRRIIKDFSLTVSAGEIVALIGPSGAGKSTLLSMMSGLDNDYTGHIQCTDNNHQRIGILFQEARLMPWMNVLENVQLVAPDHTPIDAAVHLLNQVGMGDYLDAYPGQLSGGQCRRVALARAFIYQPDILLLDEPFSSLDTPSAEALRQLLLTLKATRSLSIIYVTHDLREAVSIADRVCILSQSPMTILHSEFIHLDRPRQLSDPAITHISEQLTSQFPALLSGQPVQPMAVGSAS